MWVVSVCLSYCVFFLNTVTVPQIRYVTNAELLNRYRVMILNFNEINVIVTSIVGVKYLGSSEYRSRRYEEYFLVHQSINLGDCIMQAAKIF